MSEPRLTRAELLKAYVFDKEVQLAQQAPSDMLAGSCAPCCECYKAGEKKHLIYLPSPRAICSTCYTTLTGLEGIVRQVEAALENGNVGQSMARDGNLLFTVGRSLIGLPDFYIDVTETIDALKQQGNEINTFLFVHELTEICEKVASLTRFPAEYDFVGWGRMAFTPVAAVELPSAVSENHHMVREVFTAQHPLKPYKLTVLSRETK